jgi:hypothetical protein
MAEPTTTTTWLCDTCSKEIGRPEAGIVEWIVPRNELVTKPVGKDLRLVHIKSASPLSNGCQHYSSGGAVRHRGAVSDVQLQDLFGANGFTLLLSKIADGEWSVSDGLTMLQRIHIPGYEHARLYMDQAIQRGHVEPNLPYGFYWDFQLQRVLELVKSGELE